MNRIEVTFGDGLYEVPYKSFVFSGGEVSVKIDVDGLAETLSGYSSDHMRIVYDATIVNSEGVMLLLMLKDAIDNFLFEDAATYCIDTSCSILDLGYLPYARQDRVCAEGEAFSLKVFAGLLNSAAFDKVLLNDPHSDVAPALVNNCEVVDQTQCIAFSHLWHDYIEGYEVIISPDAGATKKALPIARMLDKPLVEATKVRDTSTGDIVETRVNAKKKELLGKDVLIVDDICDGGRTFIELAKVLKESYKVNSVALYVTHGIFSQGLEPLREYIDEVYTTTTFLDETDDQWADWIKSGYLTVGHI